MHIAWRERKREKEALFVCVMCVSSLHCIFINWHPGTISPSQDGLQLPKTDSDALSINFTHKPAHKPSPHTISSSVSHKE